MQRIHLTWFLVPLLLLTMAPVAAQPPVFRARADVVAVDVTVVDGNGKPVPDLKPEEFALEVDGRPRSIVSAEFVSRAVDGDAPGSPPDLPPGVSTNVGVRVGRLIVIVIDQAHIIQGGGRVVAETAGRFLDQLAPADRVALAIIPTGRHIDFTADRALIREGLKGFVGTGRPPNSVYNVGLAEAIAYREGRSFEWNEVVARECLPKDLLCPDSLEQQAAEIISNMEQAYQQSMASLRGLITQLATIPGPKTLIYISEGFPSTPATDSDFAWLSSATAAAQITVYALNMERGAFADASVGRPSPTAYEDAMIRAHGLDVITGYTRGTMFRVVNAAEFAFDRVASEMSGYYLLSFEAQEQDRDGKAHKINVSLKRRGLTLRARREFLVRDAAPESMSVDERLGEVLRAPFSAPDIPIRLATFTLRDVKTSKLRVLVSAELDPSDSTESPLDVASVMFDSQGALVKTSFFRQTLKAQPGRGPRRFLGAALVDPGSYTLRLAAIDPANRTGSVEHRVEARLTSAEPLQIGDLILADELPADGASAFQPALALDADVETVGAFLELYGSRREDLQDARVTMQVARKDGDTPLVTAPVQLGLIRDVNRRSARGLISIELLPPGEYVARAQVSVGDRLVGSVVHAFRIPVRPAGSRVARRRAPAGGAPGVTTSSVAGLDPTFPLFKRDLVLNRSVVGFFLDRLEATGHKPAASTVQSAIAEARAGRLDEAAKGLTASGGGEDDRVAAAFVRGLALFARNDLANAAGQFRASLSAAGDFFPALFYLGACYAAGGRDRDAAAAWQTSLISETESPVIYQVLGDALLRMKEDDQAIAILEEATDAWPDDDEIARRLGVAYLSAGQEQKAMPILTGYLERHPHDVEVLFLAIRAIYEAHAAGRVIASAAEDRERLSRYAKAYADANGPQAALVAEWRKFLDQK